VLTEMIEARVEAIVQETATVKSLELRAADGTALPAFSAGAHIDLHLQNSLTRSYSLLNSQAERHRYLIGVALEREGRGGSRHLHELVRIGDRIPISRPRNLFALNETASQTILIGGGIGVTPLLSMAKRLAEVAHHWHIHYCCRSRSMAPFLDQLEPYADSVTLRFDDEMQGFLNIKALMDAAPQAHFYCCGPKPMMAAFEDAARQTGLASPQCHLEYFQPREDITQLNEFSVELVRSGKTVVVHPGQTILEVVRSAGVTTASSCELGICGECQTTVLEGVPDHHDSVLSDAEREANKTMMICCSSSKRPKLVLDL
jgi:tetrachlorobenzoquinone reductase